MNAWHQAAAEADADRFFGAMFEDGVYIGTDASERWLRDELREWAAFAFERESAWDFKVRERNWQILEGVYICDELLDTGMGLCRSTAVLRMGPEGIKIKHYQLSLTVPNELLEAFGELVNSTEN